MNKCPEFHYTPIDIAEKLINDIDFNETDNTLEPCKASGNFYDLIPYKKNWCEIDEGRDFFKYDFKGEIFSKVIVNPPYTSNHDDKKQRKNIAIDFIFKCFEVCDGEVWVLINSNILNSLTPIRLKKIKEKGFNLCFMRILNIPKWFGRYYWICFSTNKQSIISF